MTAQILPLSRVPLSEALYVQLKDQILSGALRPGERLPSERTLSEGSGANRNAVREAIKRLQQAGLVAVRQGGNHEVLDYRREAGPELLPSLMVDAQGRYRPKVLQDLMAMRSVLAPEIAAGAAVAGAASVAARLADIVQAMRVAAGRAATLQTLALEFWQVLVDACGNTAFQLSFNAMRKTYVKAWDRLTAPLAEEFADLANFQAMARAVAARDAQAARRAAARHVRIGQLALDGGTPSTKG